MNPSTDKSYRALRKGQYRRKGDLIADGGVIDNGSKSVRYFSFHYFDPKGDNLSR